VNDFERVAKIIRYLDSNRAAQPRLSSLAAAAGLSEFHFHRLFHRWAGVTPKDFLQALTVEHAKRRLRESASVLDAALDTGLSGPGRLHDLLVTLEAASPGEFRSGGRGLNIQWGSAKSPFGCCTLGWNARGICHLAFGDSESLTQPPLALRKNWPNAKYRRNDSAAQRRAAHIFQRCNSTPTSLRAVVRGTAFQLRVWRALLEIPEGAVVSYRQLARALGQPRAARAVGAACGANPIAYLIPCHRVIRETGVVQGYRWGPDRKRALLAWESAAAGMLAVSPPRSKLPAHA
jgi:AraC family transcriptional regulator, regulatory protein of adaptative response / methylated-DNA-[protein]-cysteine methyltransferase